MLKIYKASIVYYVSILGEQIEERFFTREDKAREYIESAKTEYADNEASFSVGPIDVIE